MTTTKATFTIKESEPKVIEFNDPTSVLSLTKASVKGNDSKLVTLKVQYEDFPDDLDLDNAESGKVIVKTDDLAKLTTNEETIKFTCEKSFNPKLIVEGPGEVTVEGEFKVLDDFDDGEEEDFEEEDDDD